MTEDQIYDRLNPIFQSVFDDDELKVGPETTASDVEMWDSLNHIMLVAAIEKDLNVKFSAKEVGALKNVSEFVQLIQKSLDARNA